VTRSLTPRARRGLSVVLAAAATVAMAGFFTGTHGVPIRTGYHQAAHQPEPSVVTAPRAKAMEQARYADRGAAQQVALHSLGEPPRRLDDAVVLDPAAYTEALSARSAGRAYDGAPPTIPHAVDQHGAPACLACHERGMQVEGKVAKVMSHPVYSSCLQCHTTREASLPSELLPHSVAESSSFVGLPSPGRGGRAWVGAPPQIPHRTFMRERCASCHGVWATGLASSHPWRQSCTQCHAPSANADQAPRSTFEPLGALEGVVP
jgi:cytochrome c-type protein NapB